ncbi:MAG: hypothetical protein GF372_05015 [Candidatus Marinimicrobia bacterium]|nr:hypothetical protein [Candidatus Neomarinimicrobiota bacterium]
MLKKYLYSILPDEFLKELKVLKELVKFRRKALKNSTGFIPYWIEVIIYKIWPAKTILFYPELPKPYHVAFKLCALLRYKPVNNTNRKFNVFFKFKDSTYCDFRSILPAALKAKYGINIRSLDISKECIQTMFEEVFQYSLKVDPLKYKGSVVMKSNDNYAHDGKIVCSPMRRSEIDDDFVYQKTIDTKTSDGFYVDFRVPVHGDTIPLVYKKFKTHHFRSDVAYSEIHDAEEIFSKQEIQMIIRFADALNIQFGEFDVLRDNYDDRIYIVDAANTPSGPRRGISQKQQKFALEIMRKSFARLVQKFEDLYRSNTDQQRQV